MHKSLILLLLAISTAISSCRHYSSFSKINYSDEKISTKLNPVILKTNVDDYIDFEDERIYKHEMINNICQVTPTDSFSLDLENMGTADLNIIKHKATRNPFLFLFCTATSFGTLRTAALVGIPVGHRKGVTKLSLDIKDKSGNIIKTYKGKGKHISIITCYWGYKADDAEDKAMDKSFYEAFNEIKKQVNKDASFLNTKLPIGTLSTEEILKRTNISLGDLFYESANYTSAIESYLMAIEGMKPPKSSDAKVFSRLGMSYIDEGKENAEVNGIKYLKQALELDPKVDYSAPIGLYYAYNRLEDYDSAIKWLDYASANFTLNTEQINNWRIQAQKFAEQKNAGSILKNKPENVIVKNLGIEINGKDSDYFPSVTADESMLLFTSTREGSTGGLNAKGQYDEDLWYCLKTENGKWSSPKNFGTPVNTKNNNGIASFTGDGQYVVCGRCGESDGYGSCDIYGAVLNGNTWSTPTNLGSKINSKAWDAQVSISADGKTLVWASGREGGFGGQDLWISRKNDFGIWSEAKNLGSIINTSGYEYSPFLHPDGKTLFFSSNNHYPRIGGIDIYKTTLKEDGTWSNPQNLGYPINSESNDMYFVMTPSGLKGYFASNRSGGNGNDDIYEIIYPQEKKSKLITFVGNVFSEETKAPLDANIKIEDVDSSKLVGQYVSNSNSGKFVVILTPGRNYSMTVSKGGYLFYSENFNIVDSIDFKEIRKEILLQPIKEGKKIVLNNIFFQTGKSELTQSSSLEIQKLFELLSQNVSLKVEISGHTDNVGGDEDNLKLSYERAKVVVSELINKGINPNQLIAKGYGRTQPVVPNDTPENRQLNRRTEFKILENLKN